MVSLTSLLQSLRHYVIENFGTLMVTLFAFGLMYANMYGYINDHQTLLGCLYLVYMSHDLLNGKVQKLQRRTNILFDHTLANLDDQIDSDQRMSKLKSQIQTMQSDIDTLKYYCMSQDNDSSDTEVDSENDDADADDSDNDEPEHSLIDDIKELLVDDDSATASASEHESVVIDNKSSSLKTLLSKPAVFHISESTGNVTISVAGNSSDDNDC